MQKTVARVILWQYVCIISYFGCLVLAHDPPPFSCAHRIHLEPLRHQIVCNFCTESQFVIGWQPWTMGGIPVSVLDVLYRGNRDQC